MQVVSVSVGVIKHAADGACRRGEGGETPLNGANGDI